MTLATEVTYIGPDAVGIPPSGRLSPAVRIGDVLYLSGQIGRDFPSREFAEGFAAQLRLALDNVETVVAAAGGTHDSIVKYTIYLVDENDSPALMEEMTERLRKRDRPPPAVTVLVVRALALPQLLIEIEAIAVLDG